MKQVTVEIWSDVVCPWCYIGENRFEQALAEFPNRDQIKVVHRSFQLDPSTPRDTRETVDEMLSKKYRVSPERAAQMSNQVISVAAADGLPMRADRFTANTYDAHRLVHFATTKGLVGDTDTLVELAVEVGLDADETRKVLESDAFSAEVDADLRRAAGFGIQGVPFFVFDEKFGVSGGQAKEVFTQAITKAWEEAKPLTLFGNGEVCGPDGCEVPQN
jgi:predicted DsbA family dithiol-disulfide isomerase